MEAAMLEIGAHEAQNRFTERRGSAHAGFVMVARGGCFLKPLYFMSLYKIVIPAKLRGAQRHGAQLPGSRGDLAPAVLSGAFFCLRSRLLGSSPKPKEGFGLT
jgi:hypothetical protein